MRRALDFFRRSLVYTLTYVLGFLATLIFVAAATRVETTTWMPLVASVGLFIALALLPPFKSVVIRLAATTFFASGALVAWFLAEPAAASEPNERFSNLVPLVGAIGPSVCLILILLLYEERRGMSRLVWFWFFVVVFFGWTISYASAMHNLAGSVLIPHPSFRYSDQFALAHSIPLRRWYQAAFYLGATLACYFLASSSRAPKPARFLFALIVPIVYMLFDEMRNTVEFTDVISKRDLVIDTVVVFATALVCAAIAKLAIRSSQIEPNSPNSGNNQ